MPAKQKKKISRSAKKTKMFRRNYSRKSKKSIRDQLNTFLVFLTNTTSNYIEKDGWKSVFVSFSFIVLLSLMAAATFSGINGDEYFQVEYSENALIFYSSFGSNTSVLGSGRTKNIKYYGGGFEIPAAIINKIFGFNPTDRAHHLVRRYLSAFLGFITILGVGMITKLLTNWRGATFALTLLWLSPRFFGHSLINPKDIPFTAGYIVSIFFMLLIFKFYPKIKIKYLLGLGFALGYAFAIRSGGILVFIYYIFFALLLIFLKMLQKNKESFSIKNTAILLLFPIILGYAVGIFLWPYALMDPISHPIESFSRFTDFPTGIKVLFGGSMLWSTSLPFEYPLTWILLTIPMAFIIGIILNIILPNKIRKSSPTFLLLCSIFMFIFPLLYVLYKQSPLYDGWRHLIFIYAAGIPVIATGWESLAIQFEEKGWNKYIVPGVFALIMLEPAVNIARNFRYPYVYFNPIAGGINGAFGEYELDYWGISTKRGVELLENEGILKPKMNEKITIATNFGYCVEHWLAPEYRDSVQIIYTRYRERFNKDWDYAIYVSRFMDGAYMKATNWPGTDQVLKEIKYNNTPIAAVYKRGERNYYQARQKLKENKIPDAIQLLTKEVQNYPQNEMAYYQLADIYAKQGNLELAKLNYNKVIDLSPEHVQTHINYALLQSRTGKFKEAQDLLMKLIKFDRTNYVGFYYLASMAYQTKDFTFAKKNILKCLKFNPNFKEGYKLASKIFQSLGDKKSADYYMNIYKKLK